MDTKPVIYTREYVLAELKSMLEVLANDSKIVYIGELIEPRPYSKQRFSEWQHDFAGDKEISESIEKIKGTLETRAVVGGLKNTLSANMTKFHLINNFDWKEKTETDITTGGEKLNTEVNPAFIAATAAGVKAFEEAAKKSLLD